MIDTTLLEGVSLPTILRHACMFMQADKPCKPSDVPLQRLQCACKLVQAKLTSLELVQANLTSLQLVQVNLASMQLVQANLISLQLVQANLPSLQHVQAITFICAITKPLQRCKLAEHLQACAS